MEVNGILDMFHSFQGTYNIRYQQYVGDGDSSAFSTVADAKPYGPDFSIEKLECVGHVQKRMGTRLRTLKAKLGKTKLSDGKTMGSRGRLRNAGINQIELYYGLAIRRNVNSFSNMKKEVWAEFYHLASTNENPNHRLCPEPPDTWCKFKKALANNEVYDHDNHTHFPKAVMNLIRPIFVDLAKDELLKRCLHRVSRTGANL